MQVAIAVELPPPPMIVGTAQGLLFVSAASARSYDRFDWNLWKVSLQKSVEGASCILRSVAVSIDTVAERSRFALRSTAEGTAACKDEVEARGSKSAKR